MRLSPEMNARRLIMVAKGGISIAGIDERILIPNLTAVFEDQQHYERFVGSMRHALQLLRDNYTSEAETQIDASLEHLAKHLRNSDQE